MNNYNFADLVADVLVFCLFLAWLALELFMFLAVIAAVGITLIAGFGWLLS